MYSSTITRDLTTAHVVSIERPDNVEVFQTRDGSWTLVDRDRDVHYSSTHGAEDESRHIFLRGTRLVERSSPWRVLELGLGAGVNFAQTFRAARSHEVALEYHAVEYAPVHPELVSFHDGEAGDIIRGALGQIDPSSPGRVEIEEPSSRTRLILHPIEWCDLALPGLEVKAIFFDPFGPREEPDSWQPSCFETALEHMQSDALLGTYSAATRVKRAMFQAGLYVATAPGPGPKREVTFASPSPDALEPYELLEFEDDLDR